ncbi:MAG: hypothetical protein ACRDID_09970 [Ktedonobacterales bacterium]
MRRSRWWSRWFSRVASHTPRRRAPVAFCAGVAVAALLCSGCATHAIVQPHVPTPTATLNGPTPTPRADCSTIGALPGAATALSLPLPPGTVSQGLPSAAHADFFLECTPGATQASITAYLNTALPQAGWRAWNSQTDDAHGCGGQSNVYWQWANSQSAIGWDYRDVTLPEWRITVCSLADGAAS